LTGYADDAEVLDATVPGIAGVPAGFGARRRSVLDALDAGCHELADQPPCTRLDELAALEEALQGKRSQQLSVMFEKRGYGRSVVARSLYEEGALGEITLVHATGPHKLNEANRPDWFWQPESYGGVLADLTTHDADMF